MSSEPGRLHESQQLGTHIGEILRPTTWSEAVELYEASPNALPVAGATDLLLDLSRTPDAEGSGATLLDLWGLPDCSQITISDDDVVVGCGVTHNQIIGSPNLDSALDVLRMACLEIGSPQLRNRATVVGNIVTASPANDTISALVALNASVLIESVGGEREVPIRKFFTGFRQTILAQSELVRSIRIPRWNPQTVGTWFKIGNRTAQAISVVHAGIVLEFDEATSLITKADVAIGSVSETISVSKSLSEYLVGKDLDAETSAAAARIVASEISPIDDIRATAAYRTSVTETAIRRALIDLSEFSISQSRVVPLLGWVANRPTPPQLNLSPTTEVACTVNGSSVAAQIADNSTLLEWLRTNASTGTKEGCAEGECGACTVMLNGAAVTSCLVPTAQADGSSVVTVEGLAEGSGLHPVQQGFLDEFAVQCGFCTPGFLVAAAALCHENESPSADEIRAGLSGNLCRCTGYYSIVEALRGLPTGRDSS